MKKSVTLCALAISVAALGVFSSCTQPAAESVPAQNIVESTDIVGLWQKYSEVEVEDMDGNSSTILRPYNLYKCILPDGNFFLFRANPGQDSTEVLTHIELYGTYETSADTLCTEMIVNHCSEPELSGRTSDIHYNMPDVNSMNVWYNIKNADGSTGSNEWTPEIWKRVSPSVD